MKAFKELNYYTGYEMTGMDFDFLAESQLINAELPIYLFQKEKYDLGIRLSTLAELREYKDIEYATRKILYYAAKILENSFVASIIGFTDSHEGEEYISRLYSKTQNKEIKEALDYYQHEQEPSLLVLLDFSLIPEQHRDEIKRKTLHKLNEIKRQYIYHSYFQMDLLNDEILMNLYTDEVDELYYISKYALNTVEIVLDVLKEDL